MSWNDSESRRRISDEQRKTLINFMNEHRELQNITNKYVTKKLWEQVAIQLNSCPDGASKDWKQWRKTWKDLKRNFEDRQARIRRHCSTSEDVKEYLDDTDNKLFDIICNSTLEDENNISESSTDLNIEEMDAKITLATELGFPKIKLESTYRDHENADSGNVPLQVELVEGNQPRQERLFEEILEHYPRKRKLESPDDVTQSLVEVTTEKIKLKKQYYDEKLALKRETLLKKEIYRKEKLKLYNDILQALRDLKK